MHKLSKSAWGIMGTMCMVQAYMQGSCAAPTRCCTCVTSHFAGQHCCDPGGLHACTWSSKPCWPAGTLQTTECSSSTKRCPPPRPPHRHPHPLLRLPGRKSPQPPMRQHAERGGSSGAPLRSPASGQASSSPCLPRSSRRGLPSTLKALQVRSAARPDTRWKGQQLPGMLRLVSGTSPQFIANDGPV